MIKNVHFGFTLFLFTSVQGHHSRVFLGVRQAHGMGTGSQVWKSTRWQRQVLRVSPSGAQMSMSGYLCWGDKCSISPVPAHQLSSGRTFRPHSPLILSPSDCLLEFSSFACTFSIWNIVFLFAFSFQADDTRKHPALFLHPSGLLTSPLGTLWVATS